MPVIIFNPISKDKKTSTKLAIKHFENNSDNLLILIIIPGFIKDEMT